MTDNYGAKWFEIPQSKRRKSPRALRFGDIKVGDQLMRKWPTYDNRIDVWYYVVTDLWFDPVAGQNDETAGRMVAIQMTGPYSGQRKQPHTLRGLASQGYSYADIDYAEHKIEVSRALAEGSIVGIGYGKVIRRRPKVAGSTF